MKIVHVIQRYPPAIGGSEQWCQQISRFLVKQGHRVKVLTMRIYHEEEFPNDISPKLRKGCMGSLDEDHGVIIHRYKRTRISGWFYQVILKRYLDEALKIYFYGPHSISMYLDMPRQIWDADIVYLHGIPYPHNLVGFIWAKILRKKVVITPHFHPGHDYYERDCHYWLMKHCDAILVTTQLEKDHLSRKGIPEGKLFVFGCFIDPCEYQPSHLDQFEKEFNCKFHVGVAEKIVTFIGRRVPYKGIDHLIQAVSELNRSGQKVRLLLIGPSLQWFDDLYRSLPSEERQYIVDMGIVTHQEKVNLLHLTDVAALPSEHESFGIVFLEAWACGIPIIGTQQGAVSQLVNGSGKLVPYGDVTRLKEAITYLTNNANEASNMAQKGKEKLMTRYTIDIMGKAILEVLQNVVMSDQNERTPR